LYYAYKKSSSHAILKRFADDLALLPLLRATLEEKRKLGL
jgi:hypothetical protein